MATSKSSRPRKVTQGDRSPSLTPSGIEEFEVTMAMEAAKAAKLNAVRDVLHNAGQDELNSIAAWLKAVIEGSSADELHSLKTRVELLAARAAGIAGRL